jgi:tetratricopeptide (TPR) repeat protein
MAGFPGSKLLCETYRDAWHFALRHEIELLEATLARRDHLETRFQLAKRYQSLGMLDKAIAQYQHTVKDARYGAQAYLELLHCFKEKGQFEQALRQFQKALPLKNIEKEVFLTEAGLCAEALGEQSKAAEMYQAILEENIEKADIQSRVKQLNSNSWIDLRGKTLLAVEHQQRWILLWWKNPETHLLKTGKKRSALTELSFAQSHNNQGVEYAQRERIKAAEDEFTLALQLDPQFTTARNNLGVLYLQEGRLSEARAEFSAVLALNPDFYVARVHLALIAFKEGQWEWAQSAFRTALAQDPGLAEVALNLGDLHYATGECGEAVALWTAMAGPSILHEAAERRLKEIGVR